LVRTNMFCVVLWRLSCRCHFIHFVTPVNKDLENFSIYYEESKAVTVLSKLRVGVERVKNWKLGRMCER